jgi:hypothetical protein
VSEQFVDITDDESIDEGRLGVLRRWLVGPPRWLFWALLMVTALVSLTSASLPDGSFELSLFATAGWLALGLTFVIRVGLALIFGDRWRGMLRNRERWAAVPIAVALIAAFIYIRAPYRIALELAKPAIKSYAEHPDATEPHMVGVYRVSSAEHLPDGAARFVLTDNGWLRSGLAYHPSQPPADYATSYIRSRHIGGPWYVWSWSSD